MKTFGDLKPGDNVYAVQEYKDTVTIETVVSVEKVKFSSVVITTMNHNKCSFWYKVREDRSELISGGYLCCNLESLVSYLNLKLETLYTRINNIEKTISRFTEI